MSGGLLVGYGGFYDVHGIYKLLSAQTCCITDISAVIIPPLCSYVGQVSCHKENCI